MPVKRTLSDTNSISRELDFDISRNKVRILPEIQELFGITRVEYRPEMSKLDRMKRAAMIKLGKNYTSIPIFEEYPFVCTINDDDNESDVEITVHDMACDVGTFMHTRKSEKCYDKSVSSIYYINLCRFLYYRLKGCGTVDIKHEHKDAVLDQVEHIRNILTYTEHYSLEPVIELQSQLKDISLSRSQISALKKMRTQMSIMTWIEKMSARNMYNKCDEYDISLCEKIIEKPIKEIDINMGMLRCTCMQVLRLEKSLNDNEINPDCKFVDVFLACLMLCIKYVGEDSVITYERAMVERISLNTEREKSKWVSTMCIMEKDIYRLMGCDFPGNSDIMKEVYEASIEAC